MSPASNDIPPKDKWPEQARQLLQMFDRTASASSTKASGTAPSSLEEKKEWQRRRLMQSIEALEESIQQARDLHRKTSHLDVARQFYVYTLQVLETDGAFVAESEAQTQTQSNRKRSNASSKKRRKSRKYLAASTASSSSFLPVVAGRRGPGRPSNKERAARAAAAAEATLKVTVMVDNEPSHPIKVVSKSNSTPSKPKAEIAPLVIDNISNTTTSPASDDMPTTKAQEVAKKAAAEALEAAAALEESNRLYHSSPLLKKKPPKRDSTGRFIPRPKEDPKLELQRKKLQNKRRQERRRAQTAQKRAELTALAAGLPPPPTPAVLQHSSKSDSSPAEKEQIKEESEIQNPNKAEDEDNDMEKDVIEGKDLEVAEQTSDDVFLAQHNDACQVCELGGELICCYTCNLVFHMECLRPSVKKLPPDDWSCPYCIASGHLYHKRDSIVRKKAMAGVRTMNSASHREACKARRLALGQQEGASKKNPRTDEEPVPTSSSETKEEEAKVVVTEQQSYPESIKKSVNASESSEDKDHEYSSQLPQETEKDVKYSATDGDEESDNGDDGDGDGDGDDVEMQDSSSNEVSKHTGANQDESLSKSMKVVREPKEASANQNVKSDRKDNGEDGMLFDGKAPDEEKMDDDEGAGINHSTDVSFEASLFDYHAMSFGTRRANRVRNKVTLYDPQNFGPASKWQSDESIHSQQKKADDEGTPKDSDAKDENIKPGKLKVDDSSKDEDSGVENDEIDLSELGLDDDNTTDDEDLGSEWEDESISSKKKKKERRSLKSSLPHKMSEEKPEPAPPKPSSAAAASKTTSLLSASASAAMKSVGRSSGGKICVFCRNDKTIPVCAFCACRLCFRKKGTGIMQCHQCMDRYHLACLGEETDKNSDPRDWSCPSCRRLGSSGSGVSSSSPLQHDEAKEDAVSESISLSKEGHDDEDVQKEPKKEEEEVVIVDEVGDKQVLTEHVESVPLKKHTDSDNGTLKHDQVHIQVEGLETSGAAAVSQPVPLKRRGRGRPRRDEQRIHSVTSSSDVPAAPKSDGVEKKDVEQSLRRNSSASFGDANAERGTSLPAQGDGLTDVLMHGESRDSGSSLLKKRGPGRPPKRKIIQTTSTEKIVGEPPLKRGPGRPSKKHDLSAHSSQTENKKHPTDQQSAAVAAETALAAVAANVPTRRSARAPKPNSLFGDLQDEKERAFTAGTATASNNANQLGTGGRQTGKPSTSKQLNPAHVPAHKTQPRTSTGRFMSRNPKKQQLTTTACEKPKASRSSKASKTPTTSSVPDSTASLNLSAGPKKTLEQTELREPQLTESSHVASTVMHPCDVPIADLKDPSTAVEMATSIGGHLGDLSTTDADIAMFAEGFGFVEEEHPPPQLHVTDDSKGPHLPVHATNVLGAAVVALPATDKQNELVPQNNHHQSSYHHHDATQPAATGLAAEDMGAAAAIDIATSAVEVTDMLAEAGFAALEDMMADDDEDDHVLKGEDSKHIDSEDGNAFAMNVEPAVVTVCKKVEHVAPMNDEQMNEAFATEDGKLAPAFSPGHVELFVDLSLAQETGRDSVAAFDDVALKSNSTLSDAKGSGIGKDNNAIPKGSSRRRPGARECIQISRRFHTQVIPQRYINILEDYCQRGKIEHLIRMRERLDEHSKMLECELAGLEELVQQKGEYRPNTEQPPAVNPTPHSTGHHHEGGSRTDMARTSSSKDQLGSA